jgi:hypothetical protein
MKIGEFPARDLEPDKLLVAGPDCASILAPHAQAIAKFIAAGGKVLAIGLDQKALKSFVPFPISTREAEHISTIFDPPGVASPLAYVGPADVMDRGPGQIPLVSGGADLLGDGVLATAPAGQDQTGPVVLCQLVPWQFDYEQSYGLKRTFRSSARLLARLIANAGAAGGTPILDRIHAPVMAPNQEKRYLSGLYLDEPQEMDDPYRFFRW